MTPTVRIGTRASALARWQAEWVATQLAAAGVNVELIPISTIGDREQTGSIGAMGTQGVFTKEIQRALLDGVIDCAVHSLKDLPTDPVAGLTLAAVPERESPRDALLGARASSLAAIPPGARVATGSLRRRTQLWHHRPDLEMVDVRGNVDTRLRKLDEGEFDVLVLAEAGLKRLGLAERIASLLPLDVMLPAIGQGALGIEARTDDKGTRSILAQLDDHASHASVTAERSLLATLRGGCLAPVAAWGRLHEGVLQLDAAVLSADGKQRLSARGEAPAKDATSLGERVGQELLSRGAAELIAASRTR
ncbi:MAG: hydroxymethylbilane synthase [Pirellulales bacterium]|nr:hydroxymethylbilane synthase [Pirellulales bacterium]